MERRIGIIDIILGQKTGKFRLLTFLYITIKARFKNMMLPLMFALALDLMDLIVEARSLHL